MSKWTDLLAAAKASLEVDHVVGWGVPECCDAHIALRTAIAEAEKPYDGTADTHAITYLCLSHARCNFRVTITGPETFVTGPQATIEAIFAFAHHYGRSAFNIARLQVEQDPVIERIQ